jgi:hypothetical protein
MFSRRQKFVSLLALVLGLFIGAVTATPQPAFASPTAAAIFDGPGPCRCKYEPDLTGGQSNGAIMPPSCGGASIWMTITLFMGTQWHGQCPAMDECEVWNCIGSGSIRLQSNTDCTIQLYHGTTWMGLGKHDFRVPFNDVLECGSSTFYYGYVMGVQEWQIENKCKACPS